MHSNTFLITMIDTTYFVGNKTTQLKYGFIVNGNWRGWNRTESKKAIFEKHEMVENFGLETEYLGYSIT